MLAPLCSCAALTEIKACAANGGHAHRRERKGNAMYASDVAQRHFSAAVAEAETSGLGHEAVCRALLSLVISKYLETRSIADIQAELRFIAENCDPDTDFMFMRP
ncbi:hypothetical protein [Bradyrhizobium amphicarpaeae]|nr:hypothetical protein [Bradyrhizobium amphicarpaeae]